MAAAFEDQQAGSSSRTPRKLFGRSSSTRSTGQPSSSSSNTGNAQRDAEGAGARLFRRLTLRAPKSAARLPSLPPSLVLDLDAGTAAASTAPRSPAVPSPRRIDPAFDSPTAAAAVIAQANAASAAPYQHSHSHNTPQQRRKMVDAMANARLNVLQTRDLVRMCGRQIRERGLDSVGLFRPFRIAESQQRVAHMVQLFLLSVDVSTFVAVFPVLPDNALDRLGSAGNPAVVAEQKRKLARDELDKELRYASPHEVVSVLKWGLRHMRVRPSDFYSKDADEWYAIFAAAERAGRYHPRALANTLYPRLPQETAELLSELLDLTASVAAHAATNHMPASTLCKVLGFWVFGRIGVAHPPPTVDELLLATDRSARIAEHLLLAHIRAQAAVTFAMPLRLTELVAGYPCISPGAQTPSLPPAFASRPVSTLRIDLRSENLVVSQTKPRTPSATLAAALDATASDHLQGDKGELWAAIMGHHYEAQGSKTVALQGNNLLLEEHARILRLVEQELDARTATPLEDTVTKGRQGSATIAAVRPFEKPPRLPAFAPAPVSAPPTQLTFFEIAGRSDNDESVEVVVDEPVRSPDVFMGGLEPSASWRSFSEDGFGTGAGMMSTASSELSLSDKHDARPAAASSPPKAMGRRRSSRALYRVKSSSSSGSTAAGRPALPHAFTAPEPATRKAVTTTVTSVRTAEISTALSIMWQDQLLDPSPCCSFPCFVLVQLNASTAAATHTATAEGEPWLLLVETIIPPRPPTPPYSPYSPTKKASRWDAQSQLSGGADRKSILAPSIRSVKSTLRRVSTIIGVTPSRTRSRAQQASHDSDDSFFPSF